MSQIAPTTPATVAVAVVDRMIAAGVDFCTSVPCNTLSALIDTLDRTPAIRHVAVTREEEGVGICAGAALNGRLPVLLMQNSGLGNCLNAILSLTKLYELPLVLLTSYRGGPDEKIVAQLPMGQAMRPLLAAIDVPFAELTAPGDVDQIGQLARRAAEGRVVAGILHSSFWGAA